MEDQKKGKKSTSLTVSKQTAVPDILAALKAKLESLETIKATPFRTTGNLSEMGFPLNIKDENNLTNLIRAYGSLTSRKKIYDEAADNLQIRTYPEFNVAGGTIEDWEKDIKLRIAIVTQEEERAKLEKHIATMSKFLSEEDQKVAAIEAILKDYSNGNSGSKAEEIH